jgi:hypothetical protein
MVKFPLVSSLELRISLPIFFAFPLDTPRPLIYIRLTFSGSSLIPAKRWSTLRKIVGEHSNSVALFGFHRYSKLLERH